MACQELIKAFEIAWMIQITDSSQLTRPLHLNRLPSPGFNGKAATSLPGSETNAAASALIRILDKVFHCFITLLSLACNVPYVQ
jgi:hypothetical protein